MLSTWHLDGTANAILSVGDLVFVGGDFTEIYSDEGDRLTRNYIAAFDRYTGEPTSFAPDLNNKVWALQVPEDERTLYVGGTFGSVGSSTRRYLASFDIASGSLTDFKPDAPDNALRDIEILGNRLFIGGLFEEVGGQDRPFVASYDLRTGELEDWAPEPSARVTSMIADEDKIWLGGDFSRVNGERAKGLAAVDPDDGTLFDTDHPVYPVIDLAAHNNRIFVAGGGPGGRGASYNRTTGEEQWTIASDGNFQAVDVIGGDFVYFGGHYEIMEGDTDVDRISRHDRQTGEWDKSWIPVINGIRSINALDVREDGVHIGGDFTRVDREDHEGFAIFPGSTN